MWWRRSWVYRWIFFRYRVLKGGRLLGLLGIRSANLGKRVVLALSILGYAMWHCQESGYEFWVRTRRLWKEIIESKYGGWRSLKEQMVNNNKVSLWWRGLKEIWMSEMWGGKFEDCFNWEVGNGREFRLWENKWVGSGVLKCRIPRLFSLSANKEACLFDCGVWVNNVYTWILNWRRGPFVWEESQVSQLLEVVLNSSLFFSRESLEG